MPDSPERLIAAHLDAWNAPASPERDQLITETYSPDVFVGEPANATTGHHGIAEAISGLQAQLPVHRPAGLESKATDQIHTSGVG